MRYTDVATINGSVDECLDEISDFLAGLETYPASVLAVALRAHLEALLQAMLAGDVCTPEEVHEFCRELERDALQSAPRAVSNQLRW